MVSNSSSTSGRVRVTLVMVSSNSCSTSDRGRVNLVMESNSCTTSDRGRVILVMVSHSAEQELPTITRVMRLLSLAE
jgi:nitrate reductase NapAB chaperone NapD